MNNLEKAIKIAIADLDYEIHIMLGTATAIELQGIRDNLQDALDGKKVHNLDKDSLDFVSNGSRR